MILLITSNILYIDASNLQKDLNAIIQWSVINKMPLNVAKCKILRFTRSTVPIIYQYKVNDISMNSVSVELDLGVLFTSTLSFTPHINRIILKAFRLLGFVNRICVNFKYPETYELLYKTLVRPILECASPIFFFFCRKSHF